MQKTFTIEITRDQQEKLLKFMRYKSSNTVNFFEKLYTLFTYEGIRKLYNLTEQENKILYWSCTESMSELEIAILIEKPESTIKNRICGILEKLAVNSLYEADTLINNYQTALMFKLSDYYNNLITGEDREEKPPGKLKTYI